MSAPVKITCPDIDKVIDLINGAMRMALKGRKEFPEADDLFDDIYHQLHGLEYEMNELRSANAQLRHWGDGLEEMVADIALTHPELFEPPNPKPIFL